MILPKTAHVKRCGEFAPRKSGKILTPENGASRFFGHAGKCEIFTVLLKIMRKRRIFFSILATIQNVEITPENGASFFRRLDRGFKKRCAVLADPEFSASFRFLVFAGELGASFLGLV